MCVQNVCCARHSLIRACFQEYDPIPRLAHEFTRDAWLLAFDEFQVRSLLRLTLPFVASPPPALR